jgi:hypothetical protein
MQMRTPTTLLAAGLASLLLLAGCGQQGPLYHPDEGIPIGRQGLPVPGATGADGAQAPGPAVTPTSPDRSDEPRKRIHTP